MMLSGYGYGMISKILSSGRKQGENCLHRKGWNRNIFLYLLEYTYNILGRVSAATET